MRNRRVSFVLMGAALVIGATPLGAQQESQSPHGEMRIELDCQACHTAAGWSPAKNPMEFDHDKQTDFPLRDSHRESECATCHLELKFTEPTLAANDCAACHVDVHQGNLSPDCQACHRETSFDDLDGPGLHTRTAFPLTGSHLQITCETCHTDDRGGAFTTLDSDCFSCHETDYRQAALVDHVTAGFPTDCRQCHTTITFTGGVPFDHATVANGYPLIGAHADLRCASCHLPPDRTLKWQPAGPDDCATCHQDDYNREHGGSGFPQTCLDCHNQNSWGGAVFDHILATGYPLRGAHNTISCESCHLPPDGALQFQPMGPDDCITCHQTDFNDNHGGTNIPTSCLDCHTENTFSGAQFDHALTANGFALLGAHMRITCDRCHTPPGGTVPWQPAGQDDCIACHQQDYDQQHTGSGFPTTCLTCHNYDTFAGADFRDHDAQFFPIYSGKHAGKWANDCSTCHTVANDFKVFSCFACHEHNQTAMNDKHSGVSGYTYQSTACLNCHPNGRNQ